MKELQWNIENWHQDFLRKIELPIDNIHNILDVGCGNGEDCKILAAQANYIVGVDLFLGSPLPKASNLDFIVADACNLPFKNNFFDIVFEKDVLHHVQNHENALREMKKVAKNKGIVVTVEANRYNPIFYIHMTLMKNHQHFTKKYFEKLLTQNFSNIVFKSTESHVYPKYGFLLKTAHKIEDLVEGIPFLKNFLSYNIAICKKEE